jgi:hypothetical protein
MTTVHDQFARLVRNLEEVEQTRQTLGRDLSKQQQRVVTNLCKRLTSLIRSTDKNKPGAAELLHLFETQTGDPRRRTKQRFEAVFKQATELHAEAVQYLMEHGKLRSSSGKMAPLSQVTTSSSRRPSSRMPKKLASWLQAETSEWTDKRAMLLETASKEQVKVCSGDAFGDKQIVVVYGRWVGIARKKEGNHPWYVQLLQSVMRGSKLVVKISLKALHLSMTSLLRTLATDPAASLKSLLTMSVVILGWQISQFVVQPRNWPLMIVSACFAAFVLGGIFRLLRWLHESKKDRGSRFHELATNLVQGLSKARRILDCIGMNNITKKQAEEAIETIKDACPKYYTPGLITNAFKSVRSQFSGNRPVATKKATNASGKAVGYKAVLREAGEIFFLATILTSSFTV